MFSKGLKIKNLGVITAGYPSPATPTTYTFVKQFAHANVRNGVSCTVVAPVSVHDYFKNPNGYPYHSTEGSEEQGTVEVYRPRFISTGARAAYTKLGALNPSLFTLKNFTRSVLRTISRENIELDAVYGHFLYLGGAAAVRVGSKMKIPSFPGVGEGEFWTIRKFGLEHAKRHHDQATAFIANSTALKSSLCETLCVPNKKVRSFPNGVDRTIFRPLNKFEMRQRHDLPEDKFLVVSVGNFLHKKGVIRVGEAIGSLDDVGGIYVGSGPEPPIACNTVFKGRVPHDILPELLSAADLFVLPTLVEGCCNAIIEAMACGLPIISSNGAFNDDLLIDEMSIRVDPTEVDAIREAIITLRDDVEQRKRMARAAFERAKLFDVNDRSQRILQFMEDVS